MEKLAATRPAVQADFPFAWDQYRSAVRPCMEEHILRVRAEGWIEQHEQARFTLIWDPTKALVIECEGAPIGWLSVERGESQVTLENFYVDERYRGRGLGTGVLTWLSAEYPAQPLHVSLIAGSRASSLYQRLGFVRVSEDQVETKFQRSKLA